MQNSLPLPLASIVLATYNPNIEFFTKQIDSLKAQTYTNWKCIIIDDCSTGQKFEEIKKIGSLDSRFSVYQNNINLGSYCTFEKGLQLITGETELICFCDQDDIWLEEKLEKLVREFENPTISCIHSDLLLIDEKDCLIHESCWKYEKRNTQIYDPELLILKNTITGCSMMFRKKVLELALPFPKQEIKNSFHHDLWIALISLQFGSIKPIHKALIQYRQHANNVVGASNNLLKKISKFFFPNSTENFISHCLVQGQLREYLYSVYFERIKSQKLTLKLLDIILLGIKSIKNNYGALRFVVYILFSFLKREIKGKI